MSKASSSILGGNRQRLCGRIAPSPFYGQNHVDAALVSAGGSTIYALGAPPERIGWNVSIQDPTDASKVAREVTLVNRALSVAGSSEKSFEANGARYSHIMDPSTGRPVQGVLSVAVVTNTGTNGDAPRRRAVCAGAKRRALSI
jgi:thiamine biosynthesis lipoprotein